LALSDAAHAAEIDSWRRRRLERLASEDGWLSLTGLFWLEEGENAVGADPASAVVLPSGKAPARVGALRLAGRHVVFEPELPGLAVNGVPALGATPLATDAADTPSVVSIRSLRFHVVERGGRFAVRTRDHENPARRELRPIGRFPVSSAWRFDARFEPYAPPKKIPVTSILGTVEEETSPGAVIFSAGGREFRLDPILERGETDYWIIFGDRTNGSETYGGGRFVYVAPPASGRTVLDFNKAYNPPCVFTAFSTCPLPPPQNRLPIRVEAGEKTYT
jgi:uncharacterized protein (DUF1684 family)